MTRSKGILPPRQFWSPHELRLLRELYPDLKAETVARELGRPVRAVYCKARELGLTKSAEFLSSDRSARIQSGKQLPSMVASRFQKGMTPWNKGRKGVSYEGCKATQFKPGRKPHTWVPVGSYRISSDGVLEHKVNDLPGANHVRWHPVHRIVWEAANGPVPSGQICVFKPGQRTTELERITLDRIECITRAENARRNHPRNKSPELARLVQLKGAITRQVNRITREADEARTGAST